MKLGIMSMVRKCAVALIGAAVVAFAASAGNLTWTESGSADWESGSWQTDGGEAVAWTDGSKATISSNGTATVTIGDSVSVSGLVFGDYARALAVEDGTLNIANGATIEKTGDYGAVVSSVIPVVQQDIPDPSDARFATCVSGERVWVRGTWGGLPRKDEGGQYDGLGTTNVVYWRNRKLSDIVGFVSADFHKKDGTACLGAKPYLYQNNGSTASVQFQYRHSETHNFGSLLEFTQQGNDILARVKYWRDRDLPDGADFAQGSGGAGWMWDEVTGEGYWLVCNILAKEKVKNLTIVSNDGADDPAFANPNLLPAASAEAYSGAETLLWKNRSLADIEFKSAFGRNHSKTVQKQALPYNRKIESDGRTSVQFRYYYNDSGGVLCTKVLFRQNGNDIYAQIYRVGARTLDIARDWDDADIGFPGAMAKVYDGVLTTGGGWGLGDIKATLKTVAPIEFTNMNELPENLAVSNGEFKVSSGADIEFNRGTYSGDGTLHLVGGSFTQTGAATNAITGKLIFDGTKCLVSKVTGDAICGSGAEIELVNGGELITTNSSINGIGSSNVKMYVGPGSKFSENGNNFNLNSVALTVDGGLCELNNAVTYIQNMTVMNGAQVTENARVGSYWFGRNSHTPRLTCDGTNEVTIAAHLRLYKNENGSWNPDVQWLTVDTLADLRLTGGFMMSNQTQAHYNGMRIRKTGPAKLIFDYSQNDFVDEIHAYTIEQCVDEGTLELAKSASIVPTQPVSLYGNGAIQVDAGTVNEGGLLTVGGTNVVGIVNGGMIAFSNATFTVGARLNITGDVGFTSFRIGTSRCLSGSDISKIRLNGKRVVQDDEGYIGVGGFSILIR